MVSATWPRQRKLMVYVLVVCLAFIPAFAVIDLLIKDPTVRQVIMSGLGIGIVITIAGLVITTRTEPKAWKHIYKPIRYDTEAVTQIMAPMDKDVNKDTWTGYQDRVRASLWLREGLAEYIELTWPGSPYDFQRMMSKPDDSAFLADKPALKKLIKDMQDLGVYKEGSFLLFPRRKFLKLVDRFFKEAKAP